MTLSDHTPAAPVTRIVIAEDEELVRDSFRAILDGRPGLTVVGEACGGEEAVELAVRLRPDVLLLDIRMPRGDGLHALRRLSCAGMLGDGGLRVLVLTTFDLDEYIDEAFRLGASGFLLKTVRYEELIDAVRAVAVGHAPVASSVARRLVEHYRQVPKPDADAIGLLSTLTGRERQVLAVLAQGRSNAEIAETLNLSVHTVKSHISSLLTKLGLRQRLQAVALANRAGLTTSTRTEPFA